MGGIPKGSEVGEEEWRIVTGLRGRLRTNQVTGRSGLHAGDR